MAGNIDIRYYVYETHTIKERRIASQRDIKVRKAIFALRKQASTSPENNCQIWHWAVCAAHLRVVQHTGLAQFFSGTATLAA